MNCEKRFFCDMIERSRRREKINVDAPLFTSCRPRRHHGTVRGAKAAALGGGDDGGGHAVDLVNLETDGDGREPSTEVEQGQRAAWATPPAPPDASDYASVPTPSARPSSPPPSSREVIRRGRYQPHGPPRSPVSPPAAARAGRLVPAGSHTDLAYGPARGTERAR